MWWKLDERTIAAGPVGEEGRLKMPMVEMNVLYGFEDADL